MSHMSQINVTKESAIWMDPGKVGPTTVESCLNHGLSTTLEVPIDRVQGWLKLIRG